jgi:hypothetical protein
MAREHDERRRKEVRRAPRGGGEPDPAAPPNYPDPVDQASADSMDASDPPSTSGLHIGPPRRPSRRRKARRS